MLAIYRNGSGNAADAEDCAEYASEIGDPSFPVFADGNISFTDTQIYNATPAENAYPVLCALAPDMKIITCTKGHNVIDNLFDDIKTHAGL